MAKIFLKFNKALDLVGKFEEAQVLANFPLPIAIDDLNSIIEELLEGGWVTIDEYHYIMFEQE